jgi:hypothetical protein
MRVPGSPSAGFEGNPGAKCASWILRFEQGINADGAGEIFCLSFAGRLGAVSFDLHGEGKDGVSGCGVTCCNRHNVLRRRFLNLQGYEQQSALLLHPCH